MMASPARELEDAPGFDGAKYALQIAAAGGHRVYLAGSQRHLIEAMTAYLPRILPEAPSESTARIVCSPNDADMEIWVEPWQAGTPGARTEALPTVRARLEAVWLRQQDRQDLANAALESTDLQRVARLDEASGLMLQRTIKAQRLTSLQAIQVVRIARSVADLRAGEDINKTDLAVALSYLAGLPRTRPPSGSGQA